MKGFILQSPMPKGECKSFELSEIAGKTTAGLELLRVHLNAGMTLLRGNCWRGIHHICIFII